MHVIYQQSSNFLCISFFLTGFNLSLRCRRRRCFLFLRSVPETNVATNDGNKASKFNANCPSTGAPQHTLSSSSLANEAVSHEERSSRDRWDCGMTILLTIFCFYFLYLFSRYDAVLPMGLPFTIGAVFTTTVL